MALDSEAEDGYMSMDYAYVVSMLGQIIMKKYGVAKFCEILKLIN